MPIGGHKQLPRWPSSTRCAMVQSTISGDWELPGGCGTGCSSSASSGTTTPQGFEKIAALPGGESLEWCYGCGKCVPVCPVDLVGDYGPRKIHRKVQIGMDLLNDPDLWLCTTCMNCLRVCPKEVDMIKIMPAVREEAVSQGKPVPSELQDVFEKHVPATATALGQNARKRHAWTKGAGVPVRVLSASDPGPVDVPV